MRALRFLLALSGTAAGQPPTHDGFTIGLDLGIAVTHFSADGVDSQTKLGLSGINLTVGKFLSPSFAVVFRGSGTTFSVDYAGGSTRFISGFLGGEVQLFVMDKLFVGGGAGLGVFTSYGDCSGDCNDIGLGLSARGGYEVYTTTASSALHVGLELTPIFYGDKTVTSVAVQFGWQHY